MIRPRLADHINVRRHLVGGEVRVVLRDTRTSHQMVVGEREWRVLRAMDGTRDAEGVSLASGITLAHVGEFLRLASRAGIIDASEAPAAESRRARDVPVVALPGQGFTCSGQGACCSMADTILFTPLEAVCARAAAPEVLDAGHFGWRAFTPAEGLDETLLAVAAQNGACAYLGPERRCSIYDVRPHGCRAHPIRYVDVGDEIRVAPRIVCACELEPSDTPLTSARRGGELAPEIWVETLPEEVAVGDSKLSRADALAWSDGLVLPDADVMEWCGREADAALAPALDLVALRAHIEQLQRAHAWRDPGDLIRVGLHDVAAALSDDTPVRIDARAERLALRASVFVGGLLAHGDAGRGLRRLETRMRVARHFPGKHPLAVVNAVARATGGW